jgi:hypothetical protein
MGKLLAFRANKHTYNLVDMFTHYLYLAVFFAIALGCLTNCLPARVPSRFAFVVAAYSELLKALRAFSGRYLSPVALAP